MMAISDCIPMVASSAAYSLSTAIRACATTTASGGNCSTIARRTLATVAVSGTSTSIAPRPTRCLATANNFTFSLMSLSLRHRQLAAAGRDERLQLGHHAVGQGEDF